MVTREEYLLESSVGQRVVAQRGWPGPEVDMQRGKPVELVAGTVAFDQGSKRQALECTTRADASLEPGCERRS